MTDWLLTNFYFILFKVIKLFEIHDAGACVVRLAETAISIADKDDPNLVRRYKIKCYIVVITGNTLITFRITECEEFIIIIRVYNFTTTFILHIILGLCIPSRNR